MATKVRPYNLKIQRALLLGGAENLLLGYHLKLLRKLSMPPKYAYIMLGMGIKRSIDMKYGSSNENINYLRAPMGINI